MIEMSFMIQTLQVFEVIDLSNIFLLMLCDDFVNLA